MVPPPLEAILLTALEAVTPRLSRNRDQRCLNLAVQTDEARTLLYSHEFENAVVIHDWVSNIMALIDGDECRKKGDTDWFSRLPYAANPVMVGGTGNYYK